MELTLFFSSHCPDTRPFVAELKRRGLHYTEVDITASMPNLKRYLALRDSHPYFDDAKAGGYVGIPFLMLKDGRLTNDIESL